jgi:hypothetical protein
MHPPAGRLIVTPPGTNVLLDFGALLAFLTVALPTLTWVLARIDDGSYPDGTLIIPVTTFAVTIDERAMRAYAARIAAFAGVPVEEVGV